MDSFADATGNGQQVDGSNGTLQDLSPQTGNVHDEEEAMIAHASDLVTHHDPLGASANKHGSEHSRRRRRRSKSHSSGDCSPIGNPTRNGKDQKHRGTSCKATINPSTKVKFPHINCLFILCDIK